MRILESRFNYKGFKCYVVFCRLSFDYRCGYVEIPNSITLNKVDICCHGGITFNSKQAPPPIISEKDSYYIGFDCAHWGDSTNIWSKDKVIQELKSIINQILGEKE